MDIRSMHASLLVLVCALASAWGEGNSSRANFRPTGTFYSAQTQHTSAFLNSSNGSVFVRAAAPMSQSRISGMRSLTRSPSRADVQVQPLNPSPQKAGTSSSSQANPTLQQPIGGYRTQAVDTTSTDASLYPIRFNPAAAHAYYEGRGPHPGDSSSGGSQQAALGSTH